jgi:hypothetical protein
MKNINIAILSFILSMFLLLINECDNNISSNREIIFPDSNVSFQNHVQPFLSLKCSYQGCHSSEHRAGGRAMTTYFELFDTPNNGLIIPETPQQSRLVQILQGNPPHNGYYQFPEGYFSENHTNGIITWINEGAKFN